MLEPIPPGYRLECLSRFPPNIGSDDAPRIPAHMMRPCSIQGFWDPIRSWIPRRSTFSLLLRTWPTSIRIPHQTTLFLQVWTLKGVPGNVENVWESTIRSPVSGLYDIIFRNPPLVSGFLQTRISESPSGERLCLLFVLAGGSPTPEARMIFDGPEKFFFLISLPRGRGVVP